MDAFDIIIIIKVQKQNKNKIKPDMPIDPCKVTSIGPFGPYRNLDLRSGTIIIRDQAYSNTRTIQH